MHSACICRAWSSYRSRPVERNGRFTEFPDEEPTVKQMSDWLDVNLPVINKAHGEMMRGALPPALIQLKAEADGRA